MTNTLYERAAIARAALEFVPPLIRESLLNEKSFREEYSLKTEARVSFGSSGVSIQRSDLFNAVRTLLAGQGRAQVVDAEGRRWDLTNDAREGELPRLVLSSNKQRLFLPDLSVLSEDVVTRIQALDRSAFDVNLPLDATQKWKELLQRRSAEDDELKIIFDDIHDTPTRAARVIQSEITEGESSISTLVPRSRRYFERLVGKYDGSKSIREYAVGGGRAVIKQLEEWKPYEGFLLSLLLSSHSALTAEIHVSRLGRKDLEKAFDYLEEHGDVLSRLGGFEVGLRILPDRPEVEPHLLRLVHQIRDDEVERQGSEFKLFSGLFILVDGELARTHIFAEEPPFYRRLASLAQASLIQRQLTGSGIDYDHFCDWAYNSRGRYFYMQSLSDMRAEPRWNPDWATANQMQADFLGRMMIAGNNYRANIGGGELRDVVVGESEESIRNQYEFPFPYLAGPLEGGDDNPNVVPDQLASEIEEQLGSDEIEATSFTVLVNSSTIFRITSSQAELATKALKLAGHSLINLKDRSQLLGILNGLATIAAISRNPELATEVRILLRRYRRDVEFDVTISESIKVALIASVANRNFIDWRDFAGDWLTEIAFDDFDGDEGNVFYTYVSVLLELIPQLWISCARAEAALQAWCNR